jgi:hypothetical protein
MERFFATSSSPTRMVAPPERDQEVKDLSRTQPASLSA